MNRRQFLASASALPGVGVGYGGSDGTRRVHSPDKRELMFVERKILEVLREHPVGPDASQVAEEVWGPFRGRDPTAAKIEFTSHIRDQLRELEDRGRVKRIPVAVRDSFDPQIQSYRWRPA